MKTINTLNTMNTLRTLSLSLLVALAGCWGEPPAPPDEPDPVEPVDPVDPTDPDDFNACVPMADGPEFAISSKASLRWKRARALEQDLTGALQLTREEACSELGVEGICFNFIHLVPLGGKSAILDGMYTANPEPSLTTPISLDRVILSACGRRVDVDDFFQKNGQAAVVFNRYFIDGPVDAQVAALQVEDLYRLLLAREPTPEEVESVSALREGVGGRDFSKLACYAVASTSEFLFH